MRKKLLLIFMSFIFISSAACTRDESVYLTEAEAIELALSDFNESADDELIEDYVTYSSNGNKPSAYKIEYERWRVNLPVREGEVFQYIIDAETGEISNKYRAIKEDA